MKAWTAIWRAVSRSTATLAPPQWGHGGKATGVDVSPAEATGTGGDSRRARAGSLTMPRCDSEKRKPVEPAPHETFRQHVEAEAPEKFSALRVMKGTWLPWR